MLATLLLGRLALVIFAQAGKPHTVIEGDESVLTVQRMLSGEFNEQWIPDMGAWRPDGKTVVVERNSKTVPGGVDIVSVDPVTGSSNIVVQADKLLPPGDRAPLHIERFSLSADSKRLLIFTNSVRVWRQNTRGDYWVLDVPSGKLLKLGGDAQASTLMFAKLSPDGSKAGYVLNNNLYVQDLQSGTITPITKDGSETLINGTSDWVYEEELDIRDGWRWSPDGKSIAYWQVDSVDEPLYTLINDTDSTYPQVRRFPYPKTGQTNPRVRIGVASASGGETIWMKDVATTTTGYIARITWSPDSQNLVLEHLNRLQNENRYLLANAQSGEVKQVFNDTDKTWVDVLDTADGGVRWIDGGKAFLVFSERDGWRHIYAAAVDGSQARLLTPTDYDVDQIVGFDDSDEMLYFTASPENSTQRYLYGVIAKGMAKKPTRLTPIDIEGTNRYEISPDGKLAFHTLSRFTEVPKIDLVRLPSHTVVKVLADNAELKSKMAKLNLGTTKFMQIQAPDGSEMDAVLTLPPDFNPTKRYPVLFEVYGEPAGAIVQDAWEGGHLFTEIVAQHGYIVASVDNRGTPTLKGRAWRKSVYRKIGVTASEDQATAVKLLNSLPYVDPKRIGIWGWSGGGSMTLNMLFRYPDLYHLGMSVAPVPDMHLYDTIYQERYMGLPKDNDADYVKGSPITYAKNLRGALLIVHGSGDDNVHYQGTERLVNELVADNKPFQLMVYPNRTHAISEGSGTRRHLYELLLRFLTSNMAGGGK